MLKQVNKLYTEPKISPAKPESSDMSNHWYVWFRFFHEGEWTQLRFKKGINEFKIFRERLAEANALKQAIKEKLQEGWNPFLLQQNIIYINTIAEAVEYILKIKSATLRTKSKYAYKYITGIFLLWLTDNNFHASPINNFTSCQAQQYMDWLLLNKKYSGRTFNDHLIVLRTFFNCFTERDWIVKNPFRVVKRKTQTVGRNLAFTEVEMDLLKKTLLEKDLQMYYFTQLMFHTYIRRTELTCIKIKHIDMQNGNIIIPGEFAKNNRQESVVIPKGLEPVLKEMELNKYPPEFYLFGRGLKPGPVKYKNPNWISTRHNDIVKELGIDSQKGLYSHKHSGVCHYYYLTNKDIYAVMRQLRHRDMNTTMIYLKSMGLLQNDVFKNAMVA